MHPLTPTCDLLKNARLFALAAAAAYADLPARRERLASAYALHPFAGEAEAGRGLVAVGEGHLLVIYAGSTNWADWLRGLAVRQTAFHDGMAHAGFVQAFADSWPAVRALVRHYAGGRSIWLAGHSLGGAQAVLALRRLREEGPAPHAAFTYGCPRVLEEGTATRWPGPSYRVVHGRDFIPVLPGRRTGQWRYRHAGQLLYLPAEGPLAACDEEEAADDGADVPKGGALPNLPGTADHRIESYLARLEELVAAKQADA